MGAVVWLTCASESSVDDLADRFGAFPRAALESGRLEARIGLRSDGRGGKERIVWAIARGLVQVDKPFRQYGLGILEAFGEEGVDAFSELGGRLAQVPVP